VQLNIFCSSLMARAGPRGRAVWGVDLRPFACWDCGFESHRGMDVCLLWALCVLSGRGPCDELITRPEESYRLWPVVVCDLETSIMRRPWRTRGGGAVGLKTNKFTIRDNLYDPSKMGPIGCPETSVKNYHYSLRNNPELRSYCKQSLIWTFLLKILQASVSVAARAVQVCLSTCMLR